MIIDTGRTALEEQTIIQQHKRRKSTVLQEKAVLLILSSEELGRTFIIDKDEITIGRDDHCDIRLDDPEVSAQHCRITVPGDKTFILEDLGSTNGSFINRKAVKKPTQLFYSDRVVLGKTVLRFFLEETLNENL